MTLPGGVFPQVDLVQASIPHREPAKDPAEGWAGRQGAAYARPDRNPADVEGLNASYLTRFGIKRTDVNEWALEGVPRDITVLEVGCAHGAQLNAMAAVGFKWLGGCDISADALRLCPWPNKLADGRDLPYDSDSFDMVMTSGTLMQIPPGAKRLFVDECYRVAKRWVYGVEGASHQPGTWEFGDLIPPAWTDMVPETIARPEWKVVRSRWLHPTQTGGRMSLRAYLLERE